MQSSVLNRGIDSVTVKCIRCAATTQLLLYDTKRCDRCFQSTVRMLATKLLAASDVAYQYHRIQPNPPLSQLFVHALLLCSFKQSEWCWCGVSSPRWVGLLRALWCGMEEVRCWVAAEPADGVRAERAEGREAATAALREETSDQREDGPEGHAVPGTANPTSSTRAHAGEAH